MTRLLAHLNVSRYGEFELTDAIRPSLSLPVVPREGFRRNRFCEDDCNRKLYVVAAAVSAEHLFDVFLDLLEPLSDVVDVVLESSRDSTDGKHDQLYREHIDAPVLMSHLCEHEDLLLNDGCTGVAVVDPRRRIEVQFDEHKLLVVYARDPRPFERVLRRHGIRRDNELKLITEAEHLHSTDDRYRDAFSEFSYLIGAEQSVEWANG